MPNAQDQAAPSFRRERQWGRWGNARAARQASRAGRLSTSVQSSPGAGRGNEGSWLRNRNGVSREEAQETQEKEILRLPRFCMLCAALRLDCCGWTCPHPSSAPILQAMSSEGAKAFIARWAATSASERANGQPFLCELCDMLGVATTDIWSAGAKEVAQAMGTEETTAALAKHPTWAVAWTSNLVGAPYWHTWPNPTACASTRRKVSRGRKLAFDHAPDISHAARVMKATQSALLIAGVLAAAVVHSSARVPEATVTVSSRPLHAGRVSPMLFGNFMELLDDLVPSMWAEMLNDRSFEGITPPGQLGL